MSRRWPLLLVVVALLVLAVAVGNAAAQHPVVIATPKNASTIDPNAPSSVWFCPGPPDASTLAADRISVANIGTTAASVVVESLPDKGAPAQTTLSVAPAAVVTKRRAALGPLGALTIESFGGEIAVEENLDDATRVAGGPCATNAAPHWFFSAGTTARGVAQWLVIENPYASDAKVDVMFRTSAGVRQPDDLQGYDIGPRSRVVIPVHTYAVRDDRVAVEVDTHVDPDAPIGRVVAAELLQFQGSGAAWSVGSPASSDRWTFAGARDRVDESSWVAIANVGTSDAPVTVQPLLSTKQVVAPAMLTIAPDDIVWVQLGECASQRATVAGCVTLPTGARYSLVVSSDSGSAIVAQMLTRGAEVVTAPLGAFAPETTWVFAVSRVTHERETLLSFVDAQAVAAQVDVAVMFGGSTKQPAALQSLTVPAGGRLTVRITGGQHSPVLRGALVVHSTVPVFVDRTLSSTSDDAVTTGIPAG
jgi:hypothetical protein